jgi:NAD-dependent deacetylase
MTVSQIERARELVRAARRVAALTGAGVSAESGIATFRDPGGLFEGRRFDELANVEAFAADPALVWRYYRWRRERAGAAEPNAGHRALAAFEGRRGLDLITQNVDGLHQRAGSGGPIELHGSLWSTRCDRCGRGVRAGAEPGGAVPVCAGCGGRMRPGVVWFGESLPPAALAGAQAAAERCDLFLVLGTSAVVHPAAGLAVRAIERGVPVIEVNPQETPLSALVTVAVRGRTGEVLPELLGGSGPPGA